MQTAKAETAIAASWTKTPTATTTPTPTPVYVDLENVCSFIKSRVSVHGILSLSAWTSCIGSACFITLDSPADSDFGGIFIYVHVGSEPNQMEPLPSSYTMDDLRVHTNNGRMAVAGDEVIVSGKVRDLKNPCDISVDTIELP
ncbi:hypothetical protein ACFLTX_03650, partial [Chloroflexota bacterium]